MDYIVFKVTEGGKMQHYGTVSNAKSFQNARKRLYAAPGTKGLTFYLVNSKDLLRVTN